MRSSSSFWPCHQDHRPRQAARARHLPRAAGRRRPAGADRQEAARPRAGDPARRRRRTRRTAIWSPSRWRRSGAASGCRRRASSERLGSLKSERAVSLIAIHAHGIPHVFPPPSLTEAEAAQARRASRAARTGASVPLVTIDPADAKDHDDAVHAEPDTDPDNPGGYVVTRRHRRRRRITCGRARRSTARRCMRGNSVYFPDRVVPMLPERISNDLCSLRPNEDRAALAVRMVIGADGRKRSHTFHRVLMRSAAKLTYQQAQAAIDGRPDDTTGPLLDTRARAALRRLSRARSARATSARRSTSTCPSARSCSTADGTVDRVVDAGAARCAPADRGVHDPRQRRGGRDAGSARACR